MKADRSRQRTMRGLAVGAAAALLLPALGLAAPQAPPALPERLDVLRRSCDYREALFKALGVPSACSVLARAAPDATPDQLTTLVERGLGISRAAAALVMEAELGSPWADERWSSPEETARIADLWVDAARAAPGHLSVLAGFAVHYKLPDGGRFAAALETSSDPAATASRLLDAGRPSAKWEIGVGVWSSTLRALILARRTAGDVTPVLAAREDSNDGKAGAAVDLAVLERLVRQGADPDAVARGAAPLLSGLVVAHLPDLAVEVFRGLSPVVRDATLAALGKEETSGPDLRLDLATTLAGGGDLELARLARNAVPSRLLDVRGDGVRCEARLRIALLAALLDGRRADDPFDFAVDAAVCGDDPVVAALAAPIVGTRYPEAVRGVLDAYIAPDPRQVQGDGGSVRALLPAYAARADEAEAAMRRRVVKARGALEGAAKAASAGPDPTAATVARLLDAPPVTPFEERPLPAEAAVRSAKPAARSARGIPLPPGLDRVRVERKGSSVTAIVLSQGLDPTGEVSGGGYYLMETRDAGKSWRSTYLGLRQYRPYVVDPDSTLPLVKDGVLRLVARVRELDEQTITFPPLRTRFRREGKPVLLEARLEDLRRDGDRDGLTDLEEARLLTDGAEPDTDHDGFLDGEDPLPHVPFGDRTPEAGVISALLEDSPGDPGLLEPPGRDLSTQKLTPCPAPRGISPVRWVVGDRSRLTGARARVLIAVLGEKEHASAVARFGDFYALRIRTLFSSVDGERVFVEWSETWRGGSAVARRKPTGGWELRVVSEWIT